MNRSRKRRREARRARREAEHRAAGRHMSMPGTQIHHLEVDAVHALMERSPRTARAGVVFGAVVFVGTLAWWLLGLLGAR